MTLHLTAPILAFIVDVGSTTSSVLAQISPVMYLVYGILLGFFVIGSIIALFGGKTNVPLEIAEANAVSMETEALLDVDRMLDYDDPAIHGDIDSYL